MGFNLTDITSGDIAGKGVIGLPDTPNLSTLEMQQKFEQLSTDVIIPKLNDVIGELVNSGWTAAEVANYVNNAIQDSGGGDMTRAIYDTYPYDGIVNAADDARTLDGHLPSYFAVDSDVLKKTLDITAIEVVAELPVSPDATTLYLIPER